VRLPRMTTRRWIIAVMVAGLGTWRVNQEGFLALSWEAPLVGSFLGIVAAGERRWRLPGSVFGAAIASACVWFVNFFLYQKNTYVTMFAAPKEPFTEATAGAVLGAFVGLLLGVAASVDYRRLLPATVRGHLLAVALLAMILFLITNLIWAEPLVRALIVVIVVAVGAPSLILTDLLKKRSGTREDLGPNSPPPQ
jgi:hypothetical protein